MHDVTWHAEVNVRGLGLKSPRKASRALGADAAAGDFKKKIFNNLQAAI